MEASIFETHYKDYCSQVTELDFSSIKDTLGIESLGDGVVIPFLGEDYVVSNNGITDASGNRPNYMICVILFKYLLLCPDAPYVNKEWAALKDLHKSSQFTNLNVFTSDTEKPIVARFSGRLNALLEASQKLGGNPCGMDLSYDVAMEFKALPQIGLLLLFNDGDDEFPATCSVLFQRQVEHYLDPESLIMTGMAFTKRLKNLSDNL
jgi:hypothetical protein